MIPTDSNAAVANDEQDLDPARRWLRPLGLVIGLALLAAAIVVVWRSRGDIGQALHAVRDPSALHVVVLLGGVLGNVVLSGVLFSLLMSRYGRVGRLEMQALIASATLMNFLPLRPGLFGRLAYHKAVNRIPATDSARTVVQALLCTVSVAGYFILAMVLCAAAEWPLWLAVLPPVPIVIVAALTRSRVYALAFGIRFLEVIVWAARYWAAFGLLGIEIGPQTALALACINIIATMVPLVSNGLGLSEWAIGLATPFLAAQVAQMSIGLTAQLVNRAGELIVITITGLIGIAYLVRLKRTRPH